jgi:DNA-binding transcriptional LysR family regulator
MDTFNAIRVFAKVVEQGSFARAAERLDLSTSAVSRLVSQLETHLDARLLNRTTRRLSLTESGEAFFERSVQLLSDLDEAEALVSTGNAEPKGTLKLSCSIAFGIRHLAPAIAVYQARYPQTRFDISLSDHFVDLVEGGFDLAIRIGDLGNPRLIARQIGRTRLIAVAAPAYLQQHGTPTHPQELAGHNCLTYAYAALKDQWTFTDPDGRRIEVRVAGSIHSNNGEMAVAFAELGIGIGLEPDFLVAAGLASGRLLRILGDFTPPASNIYAVYPSRRNLSTKVRSFVDFLGTEFGGCRDWLQVTGTDQT